MDYLETLEFRRAALERKIRLLQELRFFVETAGPEELAHFGDELRAVITSSGASLGEVLASLLGAPPGAPAKSAEPRAAVPARPAPRAPEPRARPAAEAPAPEPSAGPIPVIAPAPVPADEEARREALASIEGAMKAIPAGSFVMGSESGEASEKPPHKTSLGAYRLCAHLVTNAEYALFLRANPRWGKDRADPGLRDERYLADWTGDAFPEGREGHPVAFVSFHAAAAFAEWLGKRLPTEAEWECGARGGLVGKKYPNGDQMNDKLANLAKQYRGTTPAGQFEANGFGLHDMAGNLFEWTADWYGPYAAGEAFDPKGPPEGEFKAVRGGSWMSGAGALRVSARVDMDPRGCGQVGIRLAD
jgi:formylglycine-generating enzyme required for sulfatase activity